MTGTGAGYRAREWTRRKLQQEADAMQSGKGRRGSRHHLVLGGTPSIRVEVGIEAGMLEGSDVDDSSTAGGTKTWKVSKVGSRLEDQISSAALALSTSPNEYRSTTVDGCRREILHEDGIGTGGLKHDRQVKTRVIVN